MLNRASANEAMITTSDFVKLVRSIPIGNDDSKYLDSVRHLMQRVDAYIAAYGAENTSETTDDETFVPTAKDIPLVESTTVDLPEGYFTVYGTPYNDPRANKS